MYVNGEVVCKMSRKECMNGECHLCRERSLAENKDVTEDDVAWFEWKTKKEAIKKGNSNTEKIITITVKKAQTGTVGTLIDRFEDQLKSYMKHIFSL